MVCSNEGYLLISRCESNYQDRSPRFDVKATNPQKATLQEANKKDGKALFIIHQSVYTNILDNVLGASIAKEAWDTCKVL
uniref:Retrovirus-related Pol polyprotein from transposon TNT 1-94 n=1 Tax=Cajanus cajan TaxID=3821 RepID=A0A151TM05_CAJCA|nr:hypothetical protein KK1_021677 [Cajanus cajan]